MNKRIIAYLLVFALVIMPIWQQSYISGRIDG